MKSQQAERLLAEVYSYIHNKPTPPLERVQFNHLYSTFDDWHKHLNQLSSQLGLHFSQKLITKTELEETLTETGFPIIAFRNNNGINEPLLLCKQKKQNTEQSFEGLSLKRREIANFETIATARQLGIETEDDGLCLILVPLGISSNNNEKKETTPLKRFFALLKEERKNIWHIYVYAILAGILGLTLPLGVQSVVSLISGGLLLKPIFLLTTFVVIGVFLTGLLQVMQISIVETVQQRIFARTAINFAYRIPKIKLNKLSGIYTPELVNRFFDILTVQKSLTKILVEFVSAVLQIVFGLLLLSLYHPLFVFFGLALVIILILLFYFTARKGLSTSLQESKYKYKIAHWLEELARNLITFKIAGNSSLPLNKLELNLAGYLSKRKAHFKVLLLQYTSFVVFKTAIVGGLLIMGGYLVIDRQISVGQFVAAEIIIVTLMAAIEKIILRLDIIYDILTAVEKIGNVTDLEIEDSIGLLPKATKSGGLSVDVKDLNFAHKDQKSRAISGLSFSLEAGKSLAIVGAEGSGKTTLMHILAGLYDNYEGQVSVNGFSIKDINLPAYRDQIGDSLSHEHIFNGTLLENLVIGRPYVEQDDLQKCLEITELSEFVHKLPKSLQTELPATGLNLPSSTNKRIVLARSLMGKPKLILFDDFFFNLESAYKIRVLQRIITERAIDSTIIASSHDPILLDRVDKILVLKDGKLVNQGTMSELKSDSYFNCLIDCRNK